METLIRYIVDDQFSKINTNLVHLQKSMDSLKTDISIIKKNQNTLMDLNKQDIKYNIDLQDRIQNGSLGC